MRRAIYLIALLLTLPAVQQSTWADDKPKLPADLQPVPEPPPAPPGLEPNPALEPQVTITTRGEDKIEEYRISGKLCMMKVTPKHGVPYYLIDEKGDGKFARQDNFDSGVRVPQWVLYKF